MKVVEQFYNDGRWPKGINAYFITLIPKCNNPIEINEYRPIHVI